MERNKLVRHRLPALDQDEVRYRNAKHEQLPDALHALSGARKQLAELERTIGQRQANALEGTGKYSLEQKRGDAQALEKARFKVIELERAAEHWSKVVQDHERGAILRSFDSTAQELDKARAQGLISARKLMYLLKRLFTHFDKLNEQYSLYDRASMQRSRLRAELLQRGHDVTFEIQEPFPCNPYTLRKFIESELPKRKRASAEERARIFPYLVQDNAESEDEDPCADSPALAEEDDVTGTDSKPVRTRGTRHKTCKRGRKAKRPVKPAKRLRISKAKGGKVRAAAA